jgi:hypothetical protein
MRCACHFSISANSNHRKSRLGRVQCGVRDRRHDRNRLALSKILLLDMFSLIRYSTLDILRLTHCLVRQICLNASGDASVFTLQKSLLAMPDALPGAIPRRMKRLCRIPRTSRAPSADGTAPEERSRDLRAAIRSPACGRSSHDPARHRCDRHALSAALDRQPARGEARGPARAHARVTRRRSSAPSGLLRLQSVAIRRPRGSSAAGRARRRIVRITNVSPRKRDGLARKDRSDATPV